MTYVVDVLCPNKLHAGLQVRFTCRNSFFKQAKRVLAEVELVHDLVEAGLNLGAQHIVSGSDSIIAKDHLLRAPVRSCSIGQWRPAIDWFGINPYASSLGSCSILSLSDTFSS